jgi:hypothetical protein
VARRRQGVARDLEGAIGEVSGKEERAAAHQNGMPTVRRRKRRRAAVVNGGGGSSGGHRRAWRGPAARGRLAR